MRQQQKTFTTIAATGTAKASYDGVTYSAQIVAIGKDSHEAKQRANLVIQRMRAAAESLQGTNRVLLIAWDSLQVNYSVVPNEFHDHQTREHKVEGERAICEFSFRSDSVDCVSEMQDALTSVELPDQTTRKVSLAFTCSQTLELRRKALRDALAQAQALFRMECDVFGHDPEDFAVVGRRVQYNNDQQPRGAQMQLMSASFAAASAPEEPIEIEAGVATISVAVSIDLECIAAMDLPFLSKPDPDQPEEGGTETLEQNGTAGLHNHAIFSGLAAEGVTDEQAYELLKAEDPELVARVVAVYAEFAGASSAGPRTLVAAIALGKYDWVDPHITAERFPFDPQKFTTEGVWEEQLPNEMNLDEARAYFDGKGLKMEGADAATAWGVEHSENQRKYSIIAGSASWVDPGRGRRVLGLYGLGVGRSLYLDWAFPDYRFVTGCRFLVSRK